MIRTSPWSDRGSEPSASPPSNTERVRLAEEGEEKEPSDRLTDAVSGARVARTRASASPTRPVVPSS
eukprot:CAMPEP_0114159158 /NCGR_PEP_ID=MMETSP0043_2-20121206/27625_1 /TAXON_ID=464988 /ORGANISM="Hemiselmis andersenii, Strain CCMP644" /LENGTH=66 /DNA_ID=CAMNT_0001255013 /DNA_START=9 /DNA_END=205 /DNA_ORIENTATION=+